MKSNFIKYMDRLLSAEGNFTDDRNDPGNWTGGRIGVGALNGTKFGISAASYPNITIKTLTRDEALAIYNRDFWNVIGADILPPAVAYSALDGAVNSGISQSIRWLQQAANVADDGKWGPVTVSAITAMDANDLLLRYNAYRLKFMTRLSTWSVFGKGWASRIAQNLLYGAEDN
jgi:lysozyme family protein